MVGLGAGAVEAPESWREDDKKKKGIRYIFKL